MTSNFMDYLDSKLVVHVPKNKKEPCNKPKNVKKEIKETIDAIHPGFTPELLEDLVEKISRRVLASLDTKHKPKQKIKIVESSTPISENKKENLKLRVANILDGVSDTMISPKFGMVQLGETNSSTGGYTTTEDGVPVMIKPVKQELSVDAKKAGKLLF